MGVRRDPERRGAGHRARRRRRHPVRRAGVQRLLRRVRDWGVAAGTGGRESRLHHGGAHLLWLRHQGEHRLEEDARQRVASGTNGRFRALPPRRSTRCRSSARIPVPLELIGLLEGKDVLVGAIDVATDRVETPKRWRVSSARRSDSCPPTVCCPAPTAAWCRWPGTWPGASFAPLGAGTALVRRELTS